MRFQKLGRVGWRTSTRRGGSVSGSESGEAVLAGTEFPATRKTFLRAPRLKAIYWFGIGYDSVDVKAATELGIVTNTPDAPTIAAFAQVGCCHRLSRVSKNARAFEMTVIVYEPYLSAERVREASGRFVGPPANK